MTQDESTLKWYQHRWLWFLLSFPIASVILSSIMVYTAVSGKDSLVSDNYYKEGRGINQRLELDQRADELNIQPTLSISQSGEALLVFQSELHQSLSFIDVTLSHATLASKDIELRMLRSANGFRAELPGDLAGHWYINIYDPKHSWRIRESITLPIKNHVLNKN